MLYSFTDKMNEEVCYTFSSSSSSTLGESPSAIPSKLGLNHEQMIDIHSVCILVWGICDNHDTCTCTSGQTWQQVHATQVMIVVALLILVALSSNSDMVVEAQLGPGDCYDCCATGCVQHDRDQKNVQMQTSMQPR
ncbi:hypothetical protein YC2023_109666 [Brassica napus]